MRVWGGISIKRFLKDHEAAVGKVTRSPIPISSVDDSWVQAERLPRKAVMKLVHRPHYIAGEAECGVGT